MDFNAASSRRFQAMSGSERRGTNGQHRIVPRWWGKSAGWLFDLRLAWPVLSGHGGQLDEGILAQRCDGFQGHVSGALDCPFDGISCIARIAGSSALSPSSRAAGVMIHPWMATEMMTTTKITLNRIGPALAPASKGRIVR